MSPYCHPDADPPAQLMTDAVCRVVVMVPVPCQEGWFQVCGLVRVLLARVLLAGFWWRDADEGAAD